MAEATEQSAQDLNSGTKPVDPRHAIDEVKLAAWLEANVEGYAGPLEVRQFKGGQSNPTYQLVTPTRKYVLRRKPPGKLLPSAHAVDREYKVISSLNKADFPVAKAYALCMDEDVIGTIFYVMENVEGRILWDGTLPDYASAERRAIYEAQSRHPGRPAQRRLRGRGPGRLRQARQLLHPPDRPLDQAIQGQRNHADPGDGPADRLAGQDSAGRRPDLDRPWRLSSRQHDPAPDRAARDRGAGLGTVDPGQSAGRLQLLPDELGDAVRPARRSVGNRGSGDLRHPDHPPGRRALLQRHRPRRPARAGLVFQLQPLQTGRHLPGHRRPGP
ncbi:aminoglycoside phosphotransferase [Caulobacter segnis ATCC 21756]|uniref:Aminoglycoside phosphotransferase n=1 Tax=Caulobacter segnis (strain ATCC 21756 / DSM 7131 / JCM 7823 / NBRC 15250 / LMG 17158 / TK0059) TaxID=509190 RepID=D5VP54_CAUST|nr:aminoglycoside phosphotransferase [Caulobacter segnis ATCC 21756]